MRRVPIEITRARLEAKIEELVALLDLVDGDCDLEPYLTDTDPEHADREEEDDQEANGDELDENGDEQDCSRIEDEWSPMGGDLFFDGSGVRAARRMMREQYARQA